MRERQHVPMEKTGERIRFHDAFVQEGIITIYGTVFGGLHEEESGARAAKKKLDEDVTKAGSNQQVTKVKVCRLINGAAYISNGRIYVHGANDGTHGSKKIR